jgi:hypothetical protein
MGLFLEFGTGMKPTPGYTHVDKWKHSPHIDVAQDLEDIPWQWANEDVAVILAIDVFEHLHGDVQRWLDECWRILEPGGMLIMRLPHFSNHYSWRDPTHQRVFHPESFHYWCPDAPGTVWKDFGQYYFGEGYAKWWSWKQVTMEANDLRFMLMKPLTT